MTRYRAYLHNALTAFMFLVTPSGLAKNAG